MITGFEDRKSAGRLLAAELKAYKNHPNLIVLGLPRGGVVTAYEVAKALEIPLDVFLVRKLGVPWQPELAMGAMAEGDVIIWNQNILESLSIPENEIKKVIEAEKEELLRRQKLYRGHHAPPVVEGREVILVDDGLATGATMQVAIKALKKRGAKKIIVAVPVAAVETCNNLRKQVDDLICLLTPSPFESIGQWYEEFGQISDEEVINLLGRSHNKFLLDGYVESEVIKDDKKSRIPRHH